MKKRARPLPPITAGGVPAPLAVGPCIEAWTDDEERVPGYFAGAPWPTWRALRARSRWADVRNAWAAAQNLTDRQKFELVRSRAPFSVAYLIETGRGKYAAQILRDRCGLTLDDLPRLRAEAQHLLDTYPSTYGRTRT